jgi:hypothetical protein
MTRGKKQIESVSICTVVSFGKSSRCVSKIGVAHTVGSTVTLTILGGGTKDGMNFTPNLTLKKMFALSGLLATEVNMETGNNQMEKTNEL